MHEEEVEPIPPLDRILEEYKEIKKIFEDSSLVNYSKFDVDEKKVESAVERIRKKKELKKKWAEMDELEAKMEDPDVFKPKMAGKTKMPTFFFSNLVKKNRSTFQDALSRNKMSGSFPRNHWAFWRSVKSSMALCSVILFSSL